MGADRVIADRVIEDRLAAANPVTEEEAADWAGSKRGRAAFATVVRAARLADMGAPPARRRGAVWSRRLAFGGLAAVSLAALGVSLSLALDNDGNDSVAGEVFMVQDPNVPGDVPLGVTPRLPEDKAPGPRRIIVQGMGGPEGAPAPATSGDEFADASGGGAAMDALGGEPTAQFSPGEPALEPGAGPRVVKSARVEVEVEEGTLDEARGNARRLVTQAGGFIENSRQNETSVELFARIPSDRFAAALEAAEDLGDVIDESVNGQDVSAELFDIDARLRHWRAQEAVLLEIMEQATTVSESIDVRQELAPVQETIERLEGRKRLLDRDVAFSTLNLRLAEPGSPEPADGDTDDQGFLSGAWDDATGITGDVVRGTLIAAGALVPIALLWVAPAITGVWLTRRLRARDRASGGDVPSRR